MLSVFFGSTVRSPAIDEALVLDAGLRDRIQAALGELYESKGARDHAVDLTLVRDADEVLDMGTPVDTMTAAPDGIDVYFDNVGGPQLVAALEAMHVGGRIALCGMISQYDESGRGQDINRLLEAILRRVTIRGFIVRDHEDMRSAFEHTVADWLRSGQVTALQTVTDGIDNAVDAFLGMLKGNNIGKALVRLDTTWVV